MLCTKKEAFLFFELIQMVGTMFKEGLGHTHTHTTASISFALDVIHVNPTLH